MKIKDGLRYLLLPAIVLVMNLESCQTCDNCEVSPAPKQVSVVDNQNKDLIFGTNPVYNPDNIEIKDEFGAIVEFFPNINNGTIDFSFRVSANSYFLKLSDTDTDTIFFNYGKDKHIDCCNDFDVTKSTSVNGKSVPNDDEIKIVK